jgi:hypothetical protein
MSTARLRVAAAAGPVLARASAIQAMYRGLGFDVCAAPSEGQMSAWLSSPYRATGIYLGGVNSACAQSNLTAGWVSKEVAAGWHLIPTYVGLQAPGACGGLCVAINPSKAAAEGKAAADDAVSQARRLGVAAGNPIYDDMEAYTPGPTNTRAVLTFLSAWTSELHAAGYVASVYGSGASGMTDLVHSLGSGIAEPDDLWIADWNGQKTTSDPFVPAGDWNDHQRLHQYGPPNYETYGGVTLDVDNDYLDGSTVPRSKPTITSYAPAAGTVGTRVTIKGTGLLDVTSVTFNGVPAAISGRTDNLIVTSVPKGAITGNLTVTTSVGSASVPFTIPVVTSVIASEDDDLPGPHAAAQPDGVIDVFWRTPTGGLGHDAEVPGHAWASQPLSGSLATASAPHPVAQADGIVDVFWRTSTGGLGHDVYHPGTGWASQPLPGQLASDPHPVVQPNGTIDVFWRTSSGGLGHDYLRPGGAWTSQPLAGSVASDPYAAAQPDGVIDVFWRTAAGGLGHDAYTPKAGWVSQPLPGSLAPSSTPAPIAQPDGIVDVFWRTPTGGLGHDVFTPSAGWLQLPLQGSLVSDPHPVLQLSGVIDVFWRTPSNGLGHSFHFPGGAWTSQPLPGLLASDPQPTVKQAGTIDVFWRTPTGTLGHDADHPNVGWVSETVPGTLASTADPDPVSQPDNVVDVFWKTPTSTLGHDVYTPATGWSSAPLPGTLG